MAKRSRRSLSKKMLPLGAIRTTGSQGGRVWKFGTSEFKTMRDLIFNRPVETLVPAK